MKQAFHTLAAAALLHAGQAGAASFSYDDLVGKWRVDAVRVPNDGVQALVTNDPQYIGAVVQFTLTRITWLKGTPTRPIDPRIDNCDQIPTVSPEPATGRRRQPGLVIACGVEGWGPSPGALVRPVTGSRIEIAWFDNGVLTLSRVH